MQELPRTLKILTVYGLIFVVLFLGMQWWQAEQRKPRFVTDAAGQTQMVLPRDRSGHYFWMAQINGKEVEFMVDTGATRTAISKKLADELGLPAGETASFNTANGLTQGFITQTTLVSASQAGIKKTPNLPRKSTPRKVADELSKETPLPEVEASQADSILVAKRPQRKASSSVLDRTVESDIVLENGPELFQSQSDEYQQKKNEKRMKKIDEKHDSSFEKKGLKGIGLRRRKPTPVAPVVTEPAPECISSDSESYDIAPRKKKTVCIISDEEADDEPTVDNPPVGLIETTIADFVDNGEKSKSSKQYYNKRQANQQQINEASEEAIPRDDHSSINFPVTSLMSEKRSRLSLRASPKTPTIVEVISPVSSPSTRDKERQEESRPSVNAKVISSFKEIKSNFKEMKKKPLNVSTSSAPNVIYTGKGKKTSISSREMIIESASGKNTPASSATKVSCVMETAEDEPASAEALDENVEESQTQGSVDIVENSLQVVECSPKHPQRMAQQQHLNSPTISTSPSLVSNSPLQSPCVTLAPAVIISPSTVKLLEKGGAKSNINSDAGKKRKTFSLESNTGEIARAGIAAQQLNQALNQRRHLSVLSPNPKCNECCVLIFIQILRLC